MDPVVMNYRQGCRSVPKSPLRDGGFSLVEMMIATFILAVSILALTSLTITSIQVNLENDLRNTAVRLTSETAEDLLRQPIESISDATVNRNLTIRGGTRTFTVTTDVTTLTNDLRQVDIQVTYTHRGKTSSVNSVVYKHRAT